MLERAVFTHEQPFISRPQHSLCHILDNVVNPCPSDRAFGKLTDSIERDGYFTPSVSAPGLGTRPISVSDSKATSVNGQPPAERKRLTVEETKPLVIGTHNGTSHYTEGLAVFLLRMGEKYKDGVRLVQSSTHSTPVDAC